MRLCRLAVIVACLAGPAVAQEPVEVGTGAMLRALDKINSETWDFEMANASAGTVGTLRVELGECRYPEGDPVSDAYAFLTIQEDGRAEPRFSGWMVASAPALNALDHPRYDVWVMRCNTNA